jgi:hypothetical protein
MTHDVTTELLTIGRKKLSSDDIEDVPTMKEDFIDLPELPTHADNEEDSISRSGRCGFRPSERASAAPMNSRNSGAGRSGRLLNSG